MPKIFLYGSFDRFNYGDILFPLIFEAHFKSNTQIHHNYEIICIAPFKGNETLRGGIIANPIQPILKSITYKDTLIVAGGDVLTVSWLQLYLHRFNSDFRFRATFKILSYFTKTPNKAINRYIKYLFGNKYLQLPYSILKGEKTYKLIYNAAGGASLSSEFAKKYYEEVIHNADMFTVRDLKTFEKLPHQKSITVIPDIAILVKELLPLTPLTKALATYKKYFVFQIGKSFLKEDIIKEIATGLNTLTSKTGYFLVLLPIGTAHGHEDHIALQKITPLLNEGTFELINDPCIEKIQGVISESEFFLGTSLHGAITSMSYYKPHFTFNLGIQKLNAYLKTWQIEPFREELEMSDFAQKIIDFLCSSFNHEEYSRHIDKQKSCVSNQLHSYNKIILQS